jgi:hypothetical protein
VYVKRERERERSEIEQIKEKLFGAGGDQLAKEKK